MKKKTTTRKSENKDPDSDLVRLVIISLYDLEIAF